MEQPTVKIVPKSKTEVDPAAQPAIDDVQLHENISKAEEKITQPEQPKPVDDLGLG